MRYTQTSAARSKKYAAKLAGRIVPGQARNFEAVIARQEQIEHIVNTIVGFNVVRHAYIIFGKEVNKLREKYKSGTLNAEVDIKTEKWVARGLDKATLDAIAYAVANITAWLTGWKYRRKITIDQTKVDADLVNFPVLVLLSAANFNFAEARADGFDVRFTATDSITQLTFERVSHDQAGQAAEYWVKLPAVSGTVNTEFYIYYGKASAPDVANGAAVWDANFKGVWHKNNLTTTTIKDSVAVPTNGIKLAVDEPLESAGKIGKAQWYDGSNDKIVVGKNYNSETFTVSAWIRLDAAWPNDTRYFFSTGHYSEGVGRYGINMYIRNDKKPGVRITASGSFQTSTVHGDISAMTWHQVVFTKNGATGIVYLDENVYDTKTDWNAVQPVVTGTDFGCTTSPSRFFMGDVDECRISDTPRAPAWIKADYNNGNGTLVSYGSEEAR